MSQSLSKILVHLVFSTKDRTPTITEPLKPKLHAYLAGIVSNLDSHAVRIGGTNDHIHILLELSKNRALAEVVQQIKRSSSKWMKEQGVRKFYWQNGYGAFSIGESAKKALIAYIDNQEKHHAKWSFANEFRKLCMEYDVPLNEDYAWS